MIHQYATNSHASNHSSASESAFERQPNAGDLPERISRPYAGTGAGQPPEPPKGEFVPKLHWRWVTGIITIFFMLAGLFQANPASASQPYVVQYGDTLFRIALRHNVSVDAIRTTNGLVSYWIYAGQVLIIPSNNFANPPYAIPTPVWGSNQPSNGSSFIHIVVPGESLSVLGWRYGVSWQAIRAANNLYGTRIYSGQRLIIPGSTTGSPFVPTFSTSTPMIPQASTPGPTPILYPTLAISSYEFHVNPPACAHAGRTYIKGTVYLNRNDPSSRYAGAIVELGPPDASTVYARLFSTYDGTYTFILGDEGVAKSGYWGVWLVDPSERRKSDIGGPLLTNDLPESDPRSCWAGTIDFWK